MKRIAVGLLIGVCLVALATPHTGKRGGANQKSKASGPKYQAFATFIGQTQGKFHGAGRSKSGLIPVISFHESSVAPRDRATGQASGRRTHQAMTLTIESMDAREFQRALQGNEILTKVEIDVVGSNNQGMMTVKQRIELQVCTLRSLHVRFTGGHEYEDVALAFQKISYKSGGGKTMGLDDWKQ